MERLLTAKTGVTVLLAVAAAVAIAVTVTALDIPPVAAVGLAIAFLGLGIALFWKLSVRTAFLSWLAVVCLGYAFLDRGFAHLGAAPVFIGQLTLSLGVLAAVLVPWDRRGARSLWALVPFALLGALRTVPYLGSFGIYALRDAAVWAYSAFAWVVFLLFPRTKVVTVIRWFGLAALAYTVWVPIEFVLHLLHVTGPMMPGSDIRLLSIKPGDAAVILGGIAAFYSLRPLQGPSRPWGSGTWMSWALWFASATVVASQNRGGMLAIGAALVVVMLMRPMGQWRRLAVIGSLAAAVVALGAPNISIGTGSYRTVGLQQVARNASSILDVGGTGRLQSTADWRLRWWHKIVNYTLFGEYFWTGKGFGINLADSDGFQVTSNHALRNPHNVNMTFLAREGVPGLLMWWVVLLSFGVRMVRAARTARLLNQLRLADAAVWILATSLAFVVNGSFDVYLETPEGGILFWCALGFGYVIAASVSQQLSSGAGGWSQGSPVLQRVHAPANSAPGGTHEDLRSGR